MTEIDNDVIVAVVTWADADSAPGARLQGLAQPPVLAPVAVIAHAPRTRRDDGQDTALSTLVADGWSGLGAMAQVVPDRTSTTISSVGPVVVVTHRHARERRRARHGVEDVGGRGLVKLWTTFHRRAGPPLDQGLVLAPGVVVTHGAHEVGDDVQATPFKPLLLGPWSAPAPSFHTPLASDSTRARSLFPV